MVDRSMARERGGPDDNVDRYIKKRDVSLIEGRDFHDARAESDLVKKKKKMRARSRARTTPSPAVSLYYTSSRRAIKSTSLHRAITQPSAR